MAANTTTIHREIASSAYSVSRGLLEIAWSRRMLVALGLMVGTVLGALFYAQATPVYQSKAQVLVVKKRPDNVTGIDTRHLAIEDYVSTHQTLLKSPLIIERAMKNRNLAALESLADREEPADQIIKALTVTRNRTTGVTTSNVLDLAYRGTSAEDCSVILDAIISTYKDFLEETYRNISEDTMKLVVQARDVLQKDLMKQESAYRLFRKEAPILLLRGKDGANLTQEQLSSIEAKRSALLIKKAEIQGYLEAIEKAANKDHQRDALLAMVSEWTSRLEGDGARPWERLTLQSQLYPLLQEEQKLLETRGENHPEVIALRKRIEVTRTFLSNPTAPWRKAQEKTGAAEVAADPVTMYRDYFQQQLNHLEVSEKLLAELFKEKYEAAKALTGYELKDEEYRSDIQRTQKLYDSIIKRLQEVDLIKDVGGYDARAIANPNIGKKIYPSALLIFPVALLLGGLGGIGLAYVAELTDTSFRSIEEIRHRLGLSVAGQIPYLKPIALAANGAAAPSTSISPVLYAYHKPKSVEAEAYRGVRTALYFNFHGKGHKVVQVTSPNIGDGKSTLAANLAVTIAQSGKKVLLIDADMRKPTVHKIFGLSAEVGLSSVIITEAEPKDAIQEDVIPGLAILTCGPVPPNPSELLTSPRFEEFLHHVRERFDFVIVDTPPLLAVTDPSIVANKVDGVFLNIRFAKNGRPEAERAREILHNLKANVVGVVVNDAEQMLKSSGYGYGYGYGHAYQEVESQNGDGESESNLQAVER